jgi:diguanylate cyclase (GGDEF)-like protein/PAS domain S-box-containing protein
LNDLLPALVLLADAASGRITYANQACRERLGESVGERGLPDLFAQRDLPRLPQHVEARSSERTTAWLHHESGTRFWADVAIAHVVLDGQRKLLMVATDITEQRELTEKLSYQASHDALTGLVNRREFERRLDEALLEMQPGSRLAMVLYVDLDQFKLINDTSGHPAGDQLLAQLAIVMCRQLDARHVLARLGGDEFGVLAVDLADRDEAVAIAEGLRRCVDGYVFLWEHYSYSISASIGAVLIDRPGLITKDLLADADSACYLAKDQGRNRIQFHSRRDDSAAQRRGEMEWVHRLRRAIEGQRLVLVY